MEQARVRRDGAGRRWRCRSSPRARHALASGEGRGDDAGAATQPVTLNVNGQDVPLTLEPRVTLLDALRDYAGMTGTKKGCDHGQCGACTVHLDGRRRFVPDVRRDAAG